MKNNIVSEIRRLSVAFVLLALAILQFRADGAGRIVVANDDWTLSDRGWSTESARFSTNIAAWFTHGSTGRFLGYLADPSHSFQMLGSTITNAGHTWVLDTSTPLTVTNLLTFDGVFLGVWPVISNSLLIEYVHAGGNVYVYGGGYMDEADKWNVFLSAFGLSFTNIGTCCWGGVMTAITNTTHPIFSGVSALFQDIGTAIVDTTPGDPRSQVVMSSDAGSGLYAVWDGEAGLLLPRLEIRVSQVELCWQTATNTWYQLQFRSTLTTNQWTALTGGWVAGDGTRYCTTDAVPVGSPQRFYQLSLTNAVPQ
jgi:hypothetical protein